MAASYRCTHTHRYKRYKLINLIDTPNFWDMVRTRLDSDRNAFRIKGDTRRLSGGHGAGGSSPSSMMLLMTLPSPRMSAASPPQRIYSLTALCTEATLRLTNLLAGVQPAWKGACVTACSTCSRATQWTSYFSAHPPKTKKMKLRSLCGTKQVPPEY